MNNSQVAHCWANQTKAKGRGSNFFFEGESIYSYGGHFEVARLVQTESGKTIARYTSAWYSMTTERHKSEASRACHNLHEQFTVPSFPMMDKMPTRAWFEDVFAYYRDKAVDSYRKAKRARVYTDMHLRNAEEATATARALKAHFPKATKGMRIRSVNDGEITRIEEKAKAQVKRDTKERERREKEGRAQLLVLENEWLNYERDRISLGGWRSPSQDTRYLLRKHPTKDRIETSHGAEVTMREGETFYKVIDRYRNRPSDCPQVSVNGFNLTRLEDDGAVIGCHSLKWKVMDEFAKEHFTL